MNRLRAITVCLAILVGIYTTVGLKAGTLTGGNYLPPYNVLYSDNGQIYLAWSYCPLTCINGGSSWMLYMASTANNQAYWGSVSDLNGGCTPDYGYHVDQQWRADPATSIMQYDGNFVLYHTGSPTYAAWATNTDGNSGAYLSVQNDGNLVVYTSSNVPIWALNCH